MLLQRFFVDGPNSNRMNESLWARLEIPLATSRNNIWKALPLHPNLTQKVHVQLSVKLQLVSWKSSTLG